MRRAAGLALGRVAMHRHHDGRAKRGGAADRGVEVIDFEPEQDAVAVGPLLLIADATVMVLHLPTVELQDEPTLAVHKPLVLWAAVVTAAAEHLLIPAARGFDIGHGKQRLWAHDRT